MSTKKGVKVKRPSYINPDGTPRFGLLKSGYPRKTPYKERIFKSKPGPKPKPKKEEKEEDKEVENEKEEKEEKEEVEEEKEEDTKDDSIITNSKLLERLPGVNIIKKEIKLKKNNYRVLVILGFVTILGFVGLRWLGSKGGVPVKLPRSLIENTNELDHEINNEINENEITWVGFD